ncbi:hypothetical protein JVB16_21470 [Enterobacter hormaechei]|uniref:hypothetical protein n=1 Tax=Enterobacteriaceae TaxID=543 RepID=UPI001CDDF9C5|nr:MULTISPECIES: hypothetical protein [Enterobacteriaceae]HBJ6256008.1 hypothetical protein [Salmonella enterica subsp. enterica serovar Muenchen]MCF7652336.1 hypothetical protein [Klebsiella pneumoniae]MCF7686127.1 hypothetical protein [Klebsiella pneumoniae]MCF7739533.1 hypothetical protein [Klebsiella pneumoniae]MDG0830654.1 hypothetical protein [Enterobacter hormaechei]
MTYSKYLNDPLDERYLLEPEEYVEKGAIPDEELEVRKQLVALKLCEDRLRKCSFFWRLFNSEEYKGYLHIAKTVNDNLMQLVNRTPQHKAAIRRIVNSMPESNGGREALKDFLK